MDTAPKPPATAPDNAATVTPYAEATEATFGRALDQLATSLPDHHPELVRLFAEGRFHDVEAIQAVLDGGAR